MNRLSDKARLSNGADMRQKVTDKNMSDLIETMREAINERVAGTAMIQACYLEAACENLERLERELAETRAIIDKEAQDYAQTYLDNQALAAQVLQMREVLKASLITLEKADKDGLIADTIWHTKYETLFDFMGEALTLDTKPAEQIINSVNAQAAKEEREACAALCDDVVLYTGFDCAEKIRWRSNSMADELEKKCRKCGGNMIHGKAIQQTLTGTPDFPGDTRAMTLHPSGGKLIACMKCEKCGWSVTK